MPAAFATFLIGVASFAALGMALAAVVKSASSASAAANAIILPLAFVSNVFIELDDAPAVARDRRRHLPAEAVRRIVPGVLQPDDRGSGLRLEVDGVRRAVGSRRAGRSRSSGSGGSPAARLLAADVHSVCRRPTESLPDHISETPGCRVGARHRRDNSRDRPNCSSTRRRRSQIRSLYRRKAKQATAVAAAAFSESTPAAIGMRTGVASANISSPSPARSDPIRTATRS